MRMMNNLDIYFAVCKYTPDLVRQETINVGLVIHCPNPGNEYSKFIRITNKRRIASFDDEYDAEYIDMIFDSLEYEFNYFDLDEEDFYDRFSDINSSDFVIDRTRYYVNEIHFETPKLLKTDNASILKDIQDLKDTYLYYEKPKHKRISAEDVRRLIRKQYNTYKFKNYEEADVFDFSGNSIFDYKYSNTYVKAFTFDYKESKNLYNYMKIFLYDVYKEKEKFQTSKIKIVVNNFDDSGIEYNNVINNEISYFVEQGIDIELQTIADYAHDLIKHGLK